jgi:hypothetical protein
MATYLDLDPNETPTYGQWWTNPENGCEYILVERSFPRMNRMVCLMQECGSDYVEYFVFPYGWN